MSLIEQLKSDLVQSMKDKDKEKMATLRGVKGALQMEVINKKLEENDELLLDVIGKQIKMRNDSIVEFEKAGRDDLVSSYKKEIEILNQYMPKKLSEEELDVIIDDVFNKVNPLSIKDLGKVMKEIMPLVKNKCDMNVLNTKIKSRLGA